MKEQISFIKEQFLKCDFNDLANFIEKYKLDDRKGVLDLIKKAENKLAYYKNETERLEQMSSLENLAYQKGKKRIAGIDEVGRGPLAGPLVTCSVILPKDVIILGLNDSKKLSAKNRNILFDEIKQKALEITINFEDNTTIDTINILQATKLSMLKNIKDFKQKPDYIIIDAIDLNTDIEAASFVKADEISCSVAAASIIAKVTRDAYMDKMHELYPMYSFNKNKGYGTKEHIDALLKYGACPIHRKTFIKNIIE